MKSTSAVANEFLELAEKENIPITNLKLVKMMYIAQGFSLAFFNKVLFGDQIEAWKYGPVIPAIYHEFKHCKNSPITDKSFCLDGVDWNSIEYPTLTDENKKKVVLLTWNGYKNLSANRLVELTHSEGTPWSLTYATYENKIIANDLIQKYYKLFLKNLQKS